MHATITHDAIAYVPPFQPSTISKNILINISFQFNHRSKISRAPRNKYFKFLHLKYSVIFFLSLKLHFIYSSFVLLQFQWPMWASSPNRKRLRVTLDLNNYPKKCMNSMSMYLNCTLIIYILINQSQRLFILSYIGIFINNSQDCPFIIQFPHTFLCIYVQQAEQI